MSITNGIVSSKIYDKRDDFNFEIVNFHFLDGDVPRSPSYGVYISQLIRFARVSSYVDDFNNRNLFLTAKLSKQGYRCHKIRKAFSKFYHRHSELIVMLLYDCKSISDDLRNTERKQSQTVIEMNGKKEEINKAKKRLRQKEDSLSTARRVLSNSESELENKKTNRKQKLLQGQV